MLNAKDRIVLSDLRVRPALDTADAEQIELDAVQKRPK